MKKRKYILFFSVILFIVFVIFASKRIFHKYDETGKEYGYLSLFSEVVSLVKTDYVEKVKPEEKFPGAFSGMLGSLDKFSTYLDKRQTEIYNLYTQDKAYNCGVYGVKAANYFYITDIGKGSSAEAAGVKPGWIIRAVNGKSIFGWTYWQMRLSLLSDKPGPVRLILYKGDSDTPLEMELSTQPTVHPPIFTKIDSNTFLLQLSRIDNDRMTALKNHLEQELTPGQPAKFIIDLREYDGGDLEPFIQLTKLLFKKQVPLTLKLKQETKTFMLGSDTAPDYRAAVIFDKSTILYGELLVNLFRMTRPDDKKIALVGARTGGFISKSSHIKLDDGSSILLTTGFFLINGAPPDKTGVKPDIIIKEKNFPGVIRYCMTLLDKPNE